MARKKNEITLKEPVRIREKNLKDGNKSLYLDIYLNGNRKKEGLKLYIVPEVNAAAKQKNKNTWKLAEQIKAQRILDIQKVGMVDWEKVKKINTTLVDWVEKEATCTEEGYKTRKCISCATKETVNTQNPLNHKSNGQILRKEPTCTEDGYEKPMCIRCGEGLGQGNILKAKGHLESDKWLVYEEATCRSTGRKVKICTRCNTILRYDVIKVGEGHIPSRCKYCKGKQEEKIEYFIDDYDLSTFYFSWNGDAFPLTPTPMVDRLSGALKLSIESNHEWKLYFSDASNGLLNGNNQVAFGGKGKTTVLVSLPRVAEDEVDVVLNNKLIFECGSEKVEYSIVRLSKFDMEIYDKQGNNFDETKFIFNWHGGLEYWGTWTGFVDYNNNNGLILSVVADRPWRIEAKTSDGAVADYVNISVNGRTADGRGIESTAGEFIVRVNMDMLSVDAKRDLSGKIIFTCGGETREYAYTQTAIRTTVNGREWYDYEKQIKQTEIYKYIPSEDIVSAEESGLAYLLGRKLTNGVKLFWATDRNDLNHSTCYAIDTFVNNNGNVTVNYILFNVNATSASMGNGEQKWNEVFKLDIIENQNMVIQKGSPAFVSLRADNADSITVAGVSVSTVDREYEALVEWCNMLSDGASIGLNFLPVGTLTGIAISEAFDFVVSIAGDIWIEPLDDGGKTSILNGPTMIMFSPENPDTVMMSPENDVCLSVLTTTESLSWDVYFNIISLQEDTADKDDPVASTMYYKTLHAE